MPTIRGLSATNPSVARAALISIAGGPTAGGTPNRELELERAILASAAQGKSSAVIRREFGTGAYPHQSALAVRSPLTSLRGRWVDIKFAGGSGQTQSQFRGKIINERTVMGSPYRGVQTWEAIGPVHLLSQVTVSRSYWVEGVGVATVVVQDTVPSFNERDELGTLAGNRSATPGAGSYVFGGTDLWTRGQALAYLLDRFGPGGIEWTVSGDRQLLDAATDAIGMAASGTLENAIARIISPEFGLDYFLVPSSGGFELRVFSLSQQTVAYRNATVPANPRKVQVTPGAQKETRVVEFTASDAQRYHTIRVMGQPAVVCFTLRASAGHLVPKWASALEATYLAGTGTPSDDLDLHDQARRRPRLQGVFSAFGAPHPFKLASVRAGIEVNGSGEVASLLAPHQSLRRSTLTWLPLRAGYDYSTGAEVSEVISDHEADQQRPMAWVLDPTTSRYVRVEDAGLAIAPSVNDWGLNLYGQFPHVIALNHWSGAEASALEPIYDHQTMVATIAVQTDVRLAIEAVVDQGADQGSVLELDVAGAELWVAARGTVIGTDAAGQLEELSSYIELRNDAARLEAVMAGAVARYMRTRGRATVRLEGYQPYANAIGSILTTVRLGGTKQDVGAPVTSVVYQGGPTATTQVRAGYSR